jgi:FkbM family methyltransferase
MLARRDLKYQGMHAFPHYLKKAARTIQVRFPAATDAKFLLQNAFYRRSGLLFRPEYGGLRHFDLTGKLLIDIGANRGQSIIAFQNTVRSAKIVAFEANPYLAERLKADFAADSDITIHSFALAADSTEINIFEPYYGAYRFDGLASVHVQEAAGWLNADRIYFFDRQKVHTVRYRVAARSLDSFALAPALIKMHVQRAEIEVLKGSEKTLDRHRPIIMSAWPWPQLIDNLAKLGYSYYGYKRGRFIPRIRGYMNWFLLAEHELCLKQQGRIETA